ncbi:hypothetical protein H9P43_007185 [Blastocladiella emersonii ATCC 22665]|nr:hypothetical protein H9P43_007185 [Blastocladiella emersonii ATCC 22665]
MPPPLPPNPGALAAAAAAAAPLLHARNVGIDAVSSSEFGAVSEDWWSDRLLLPRSPAPFDEVDFRSTAGSLSASADSQHHMLALTTLRIFFIAFVGAYLLFTLVALRYALARFAKSLRREVVEVPVPARAASSRSLRATFAAARRRNQPGPGAPSPSQTPVLPHHDRVCSPESIVDAAAAAPSPPARIEYRRQLRPLREFHARVWFFGAKSLMALVFFFNAVGQLSMNLPDISDDACQQRNRATQSMFQAGYALAMGLMLARADQLLSLSQWSRTHRPLHLMTWLIYVALGALDVVKLRSRAIDSPDAGRYCSWEPSSLIFNARRILDIGIETYVCFVCFNSLWIRKTLHAEFNNTMDFLRALATSYVPRAAVLILNVLGDLYITSGPGNYSVAVPFFWVACNVLLLGFIVYDEMMFKVAIHSFKRAAGRAQRRQRRHRVSDAAGAGGASGITRGVDPLTLPMVDRNGSGPTVPHTAYQRVAASDSGVHHGSTPTQLVNTFLASSPSSSVANGGGYGAAEYRHWSPPPPPPQQRVRGHARVWSHDDLRTHSAARFQQLRAGIAPGAGRGGGVDSQASLLTVVTSGASDHGSESDDEDDGRWDLDDEEGASATPTLVVVEHERAPPRGGPGHGPFPGPARMG